ncbi:hypothetical protein CEXT_453101 [Caerostris extrusa]|uniref:Uncharacterized protein n=1 Tax=Caerostris extrusa TaxID=172846 RepID=A0AAV4XU32_CAEEX|nr:hypothetical protein CEXT_453101 [Caerostris extrusa]
MINVPPTAQHVTCRQHAKSRRNQTCKNQNYKNFSVEVWKGGLRKRAWPGEEYHPDCLVPTIFGRLMAVDKLNS